MTDLIVPPHSKTVALQLAIADYLNQQTGIDWREFSDILPVRSEGLNYSGLLQFTRKGGEGGDRGFVYRVQTRLRCSGNDKRVIDESICDWADFLDGLLLKCISINGMFRSVSLYQNVRLAPESEWMFNMQQNQDGGATGTINRTWKLEID